MRHETEWIISFQESDLASRNSYFTPRNFKNVSGYFLEASNDLIEATNHKYICFVFL